MYRESFLGNGLRLITSNMPHTRSVSVVFFTGVGSRYEAGSEAGISHFIEHICFKGTEKRRSAREISEAIENVGGIINGGTDKELTTFWCMVASQHFPLVFDVLADLLRNPRFDAEDIDQERQIITEEINMSLDSPRQRVGMLIDELLWLGHPLGRDVAGSKETVSSITRQQMLDFFSSHYVPNATVVSVAGNIKNRQVQDILQKTLSNWSPGKLTASLPNNTRQEAARLNVEFRDTEQAQLCLGVPGLSLHHPDRFALNLLSIVLGEGMSSRLFTEIREKQGLAYDIHSYSDNLTDSGAMIIYAGVDRGRVEDALRAILDQLSQLKDNISEIELNKSKELAKGRLILGLESSRNVASWLGSQALLTNEILTVDKIIPLIEVVTTEDLTRVARQLLTSEKLNLAIVGPIKEKETLTQMLQL
jgi:predicted Zn-dependent peptidase